jgi:hypothetical protein
MMMQRFTSAAGVGALAVTVSAAVGGCSRRVPVSVADVYTVRGVVEKLPQAEGPDRDLYIHHASIPDFRDERGKVVGMMSMTMPFPVAGGVSLAGIAPGDPVEFTFSISWKQPAGYQVIRIRKLPAGTVVDLTSH